MAQIDRFEAKDIKRKMDKKKQGKNGDSKPIGEGKSKNEMKSSKFFKKMQEVAKDDQTKKENKKRAKMEGKDSMMPLHNHQSSKKFKL